MKQEIIDMARQAGFDIDGLSEGQAVEFYEEWINKMEAFAKLVEEHTQVKLFCDGVGGAVAAEREACAKICSDLADKALVSGDEDALIYFEQAEDAIRARGQA